MDHAQEVPVGVLLGRRVHDIEGQPVGRIEEICAAATDGRCVVTEYVTGTRGAFERLSSRRVAFHLLQLIGVRSDRGGARIPAALMDLSDPCRPRLMCAGRDLPELAVRQRRPGTRALARARRVFRTRVASVQSAERMGMNQERMEPVGGPASVARVRRLRMIAVLVLIAGLAGAGAFYAVELRTAPPPLDELSAPGYLRARQHDVEVMMGPMGVTLLRWQDALEQPGAEAIGIAAASALVALGFSRAATRAERE